MRTHVYALPLALALFATPGRAQAQQAAADALFDSGRKAMERGAFDEACEQFLASDKLDAEPGTELNLADCEEKRGHLASAWVLFRTVEDKLPENDERLPVAHARAKALQPRVPKLTLSLAAGAPPSCSVRDGTIELGAAAFGVPLPLEPGAHELVVSAPGYESRNFQIQLAPGEVRAISVSPGPLAGATPAAPPAPPENTEHPRGSTQTLGFTLAGVGVAGLGVGAIAGVLMLSKKHALEADCQPDKSCSAEGVNAAHAASTWQTVSNIGWVVGGAALGAGAYFLLSGGSSKPSTAVTVATTATGGQLSLQRSW